MASRHSSHFIPGGKPLYTAMPHMGLPVILQNLLQIALKSILKHKLRSMLTSLGIIIGVAVSYLIGSLASLPSAITAQSIVLGLLFGVVTTTIAGFYPASRAARLDPIEALRAE